MDAQLGGASQRQYRIWCEGIVAHLVQRALEVGNDQDAPLTKRRKGLCGLNASVDQCIGYWLTLGVVRITLEPVGIVQQAVAEHRLCFCIGHRRGRELLRETGRVLRDVGKMRGVPALVEQRIDGPRATADLVGLGICCEIDLARNPLVVGVVIRWNGAVAKAILVFALALQQVQLHGGAAVGDTQLAKALQPAL